MADGVRQYEARLVPSSDGKVLTIVRDITDRRRAEAALDEANSELTRISRLAAQGEFAASLAHEVRQPLTTILMSARVGLKILNAAPPDLGEVRETLSEDCRCQPARRGSDPAQSRPVQAPHHAAGSARHQRGDP